MPVNPTSAPAAPANFQVALLGFSDFERGALASYFRLSPQRQPSYALTDAADTADFLIVDADQPELTAQARRGGRLASSLFIGAQAPVEAGAWMTRPIDPVHVMRELDVMVVMRRTQPSAPAAAVPAAAVAAPTVTGLARADARVDVLLVDDSEVALRFLEKHLSEMGLTTARAAGSTRALDLLSQRPFRIALIDVDLGEASELDGLALCHRIRHSPPLPGHSLPVLALVSAHNGPADKVRAELAGCDAFFPKPLDLTELRQFLARHGVVRRASTPAV